MGIGNNLEIDSLLSSCLLVSAYLGWLPEMLGQATGKDSGGTEWKRVMFPHHSFLCDQMPDTSSTKQQQQQQKVLWFCCTTVLIAHHQHIADPCMLMTLSGKVCPGLFCLVMEF
jgi:hypothetical protein